jgi:proline iminopeptidase
VWVELARGIRVFCDIEGDDRAPAVVLIHGAEVDHSFFKPWVSPLASQARLVYVDLTGHGRSDPGTEDDWTLDSWADSVDEVCALLGLAAPIILGSSLGGRVAMELATRHPERCRALILVNTVGVNRPDRRIEMMGRLGGVEAADAARRDFEAPTAHTTAEYFRLCMPLLVRRPYADDELARIVPPAPGVIARLIELVRVSEDLLPGLHAVVCPVLVLTGDSDPAATPDDAADIAAAIGDNAQLEVIEDAGHGVYRDQPELFLASVRGFLQRLR